MRRQLIALVLVLLAPLLLPACARLGSLSAIIQPPRFEAVPGRPAEIGLAPPSLGNPTGGASVTVWLQVTNPNPFGLTLSRLETTLLLGGTRAATGDFPLGLPLGAGQTSVLPLDLSISFADLPGLATVMRSAAAGAPLAYQLDGIVGINAGALGQPTFGPMRLVSGEVRAPAGR